MCTYSPEFKTSEMIEHGQRLELILDLTRRIQLLDDLMQVAREPRVSAADDPSPLPSQRPGLTA